MKWRSLICGDLARLLVLWCLFSSPFHLYAVDAPPVVSNPIPDQAGTYGAAFSFTINPGTFTDPDGDTLSYSATNLPPGLSLTSTNLTIAGTPTNPGTYTVSIVATDTGTPALSATNQFQFVVSKATLAVVALDQSRHYGTNNPALDLSYLGFAAGDTSAVLTNPPVVSTTASNRSPVGAYPIVLSGGADYRYDIFLTNGTLTITKAVLNAQAEDKVKLLNTPVPALTVSYVGLAPGDTPADLDVAPTPTTSATSGSAAGTYPILLSGGSDANYDLVLANGTLTVRSTGEPRVSGTFYGLFYESTSVHNDRSGSLTLTTRDGASFSAVLRTAGRRYSLTGVFDDDGLATVQVNRVNDFPINVELQLGGYNGLDQITGRVGDAEGAWTADLLVRIAPYDRGTNRAPQAGKYTLAMRGTDSIFDEPFGHGFAVVTVDAQGRAHLTARLSDGTAATQGLFLTGGGICPCYIPLYSGKGSVIGWMTFTNLPLSDVSGQMNWIHPVSSSKTYPFGFSVTRTVYGARYTAPSRGERVLDLPQCRLAFRGGLLFFQVSSAMQLDPDNKVRDFDGRVLPIRLHTRSGRISGEFMNRFGGQIIPYQGVLIEKTNVAAGYFLAPGTTSGRVDLMTNSP